MVTCVCFLNNWDRANSNIFIWFSFCLVSITLGLLMMKLHVDWRWRGSYILSLLVVPFFSIKAAKSTQCMRMYSIRWAWGFIFDFLWVFGVATVMLLKALNDLPFLFDLAGRELVILRRTIINYHFALIPCLISCFPRDFGYESLWEICFLLGLLRISYCFISWS